MGYFIKIGLGMTEIKIKRVYEDPSDTDGYRVLVDRLWPRGISKQAAAIDEWLKEIAPSAALRKWFGHVPERFIEFKKLYREELKSHTSELKRLKAMDETRTVTLLYGAKDPKMNQAVVLMEVLDKMK